MKSRYFKRSEFACRCECGFDTVDFELLRVLEDLREFYGVPVIINSAARCLKHNRDIGSTDKSQHTKGRAADVVVYGVNPIAVHAYLDKKYPDSYGLGFYPNFTHVDTRSTKARWS
jgi:uncharacterized protein YcbK (DUF882 family)